MIRFSGSVDGVEVLDRAFNRVEGRISDFRFVWPYVAQEFYAIEEEQFASEGGHGLSGRWAKLSPAYAKWKAVNRPGAPLLRMDNALYESMTSPTALDSIYRPESDQLTIGSKAPYAVHHQRGTSKMPARPPISLTEADKRRMQKAIQLPLVQFIRQQGLEVIERAA